MHALVSFSPALCPGGTAAPSLGADYVPVSDAAIGAIRLVPENAAEVTAPCDSRLAALTSLRARVEAMALSTEPLTLLAAYDDLYNLANTTSLEAATIKDTHPDAAIRASAEGCLQRAHAALVEMAMSRPLYARLMAVLQPQNPPPLPNDK